VREGWRNGIYLMDLYKRCPDELSYSTRLVVLLDMELRAAQALYAVVVITNPIALGLGWSANKV
jgi:hypothetical protein